MIIALRKECDVLDVATDGEWGNKTHFMVPVLVFESFLDIHKLERS